MARKVGRVSDMSAANQFKRSRNTNVVIPKRRQQTETKVYKNLPEHGGNGLDNYVLNVMKLD